MILVCGALDPFPEAALHLTSETCSNARKLYMEGPLRAAWALVRARKWRALTGHLHMDAVRSSGVGLLDDRSSTTRATRR